MTGLLSGELFAGVGGLGMAVDEVFGSDPGWFCEFDAAPSKVLAHRYPDVPNIGDVRTADWANLEPVQILAGGFPCQDVSLAGARRGMKEGTRSGLWSEFAQAIDTIRPEWVIIENVRGLLSADAAGDVEPCPWCLGDDGEQHALRALGAVLGDLAELGFDAEWTGLRAADIGAPHGRFRVFILAWPSAYSRGGQPERRGGHRELAGSPRTGEVVWGQRQRDGDAAGDSGAASALTLLPTPVASSGAHGGPGRTYGDGTPTLDGISRLLPTPTAKDSAASGGSTASDVTLTDAVVRTDLGRRANQRHGLLPTPRTTDMNGPGVHGEGGMDLRTAATLLPTPRATRGGSNTEIAYGLGGSRTDEARTQGQVVPGTDWGTYAAAVERWARVIGREAPSPVRHDGKGGKARLNPELPEWMMGWPAGWITDPAIGLTRAEQLKCAGNGVVSQQAAHALREMFTRPGVPAIRQGVSA